MDDRKLIYADDVINALCEASDGDAATIAAFMELVDKIPAVDALVLPCKVGDTLFVLFRDVSVCRKGYKYIEKECETCTETCDSYATWRVRAIKKVSLMDIASFIQCGCFGKNVFFTLEAAEAALANGGLRDEL